MSTIRVVLVEDDLRVARVNRDLLEMDSDVHVIGTAANCAQGDQLVRNLQPDLVLLDVYLPDGTGLELLQAWRARDERFDVVMVTAASDVAAIRGALAHGVLDYLIKPFDRARLADTLRRFRARRRHLHDTFDQQRLDRYLGLSSEPTLPKGIDARTLERVAQLLDAQGVALSAEDVGSHVGLSRVTAWRYLEFLVSVNRARLDYHYGSTGRPAKLYRAARPEPGKP